MKKQIKLLALIAVVLVAVMVLVSCGGDSGETEKPKESATEPAQSETEPAQSETEPGTEPAASETEPAGSETEPGESTEPGDGPIPIGPVADSDREAGKWHVRFIGIEYNENGQLVEVEIGSANIEDGGRARAPKVTAPEGWKWLKTWDHTFTNVYEDMDIRADFAQLQLFTVSFVGTDGNTIATYTVYEDEGLDVKNVPAAPQTLGSYFIGWGLSVDGAEPTKVSTEYKKVTKNLVYKPLYGDTTAVAPYVPKSTMVLDGDKDEAYTKYTVSGKTNVFHLFVDPSYDLKEIWPEATGYTKTSYWADPADTTGATFKYTQNTMDAYVVWDGDFVYVLVEVTDATLGGRSNAYITNNANAYLNDTVELWYNFEKVWTSTQNKLKVGIDAMGIRRFGDPGVMMGDAAHTMSSWFNDIEVATKVLLKSGEWVSIKYDGAAWKNKATGAVVTKADLGDKYRAEFKIPAKTEAPEGSPVPEDEKPLKGWETLSAYDVLHMCLQNNDVQAWDTAEDAKGEATPDADYFRLNFTACGRTQYWYPAYDTISLAAETDTVEAN